MNSQFYIAAVVNAILSAKSLFAATNAAEDLVKLFARSDVLIANLFTLLLSLYDIGTDHALFGMADRSFGLPLVFH